MPASPVRKSDLALAMQGPAPAGVELGEFGLAAHDQGRGREGEGRRAGRTQRLAAAPKRGAPPSGVTGATKRYPMRCTVAM